MGLSELPGQTPGAIDASAMTLPPADEPPRSRRHARSCTRGIARQSKSRHSRLEPGRPLRPPACPLRWTQRPHPPLHLTAGDPAAGGRGQDVGPAFRLLPRPARHLSPKLRRRRREPSRSHRCGRIFFRFSKCRPLDGRILTSAGPDSTFLWVKRTDSHVCKHSKAREVSYPWEAASSAHSRRRRLTGTGCPVSRKAPAPVGPRSRGPVAPQLSF